MGKEKVYTMPELLKARNNIVAAYGLDIVSAGRLVGYYNGGGPEKRPDIIGDMINGDLSGAAVAAAALHISLGVNPGSTSAASDQKNSAGSNKKNLVSRKEKTTKQNKRTTKEGTASRASLGEPKTKKSKEGKAYNNTAGGGDTSDDIREKMRGLSQLGNEAKKRKLQAIEKSRGGNIEKVTGDIIQDTPSGALPDNVPGLVMDIIQSYCDQNNITDLSKERQPRWGAACYMVGQAVFKYSKILHDMEREKINGGTVYDVGRVSALVDLWGVLCQNFCKAPLIDDFAHFAGLSDSWLYGVGSPEGLTPARASLLQKLKRMQESGLSGLIVDGRQNPTGALAALNHWHGWTQTREIIHTSGAASVSAPSLPVFDGSGGFLEDKSGENSTNV